MTPTSLTRTAVVPGPDNNDFQELPWKSAVHEGNGTSNTKFLLLVLRPVLTGGPFFFDRTGPSFTHHCGDLSRNAPRAGLAAARREGGPLCSKAA